MSYLKMLYTGFHRTHIFFPYVVEGFNVFDPNLNDDSFLDDTEDTVSQVEVAIGDNSVFFMIQMYIYIIQGSLLKHIIIIIF